MDISLWREESSAQWRYLEAQVDEVKHEEINREIYSCKHDPEEQWRKEGSPPWNYLDEQVVEVKHEGINGENFYRHRKKEKKQYGKIDKTVESDLITENNEPDTSDEIIVIGKNFKTIKI